jgi:acyl carrier protein
VSREHILAIIRRHLRERHAIDPEAITEETRWENLPGDSLDLVELVMEFEDTYKLKPGSRAEPRFNTVGDLIDYIAMNYELGNEEWS